MNYKQSATVLGIFMLIIAVLIGLIVYTYDDITNPEPTPTTVFQYTPTPLPEIVRITPVVTATNTPTPDTVVESQPIITVTATQTVKEIPQDDWYTIECGDTLWDISKKYYGTGMMAWDVCASNAIGNCDLIYPEDRIRIPVFQVE